MSAKANREMQVREDTKRTFTVWPVDVMKTAASMITATDPRGLEPPRKATCYWWDRPNSPYDNALGLNRRHKGPLVTLPWPLPGDPMPDYMPDGRGDIQPTCMYWWRPPRRCELACMAASTAICGVATSGGGIIVSQTIGRGCQLTLAKRCEKSCGEPPPCTTGSDFSYGAP